MHYFSIKLIRQEPRHFIYGRSIWEPHRKSLFLVFILESNRFAPSVGRADFAEKFLAYDSELLEDARSEYPKACSTLTGFVREMDDIGLWTPAPLVYADEGAAGPIEHSFFLELREEMRTRLLAAMPVDGVYFAQHGAAISTEHPDPDGELYEMVREIVGPDVPIVSALDLHAIVSEKMVEMVDVPCLPSDKSAYRSDGSRPGMRAGNV